MNETDQQKGPSGMRVYQLSAQARNQAAQFEPLRTAILDWVSANVFSLDEAERRIAHRTYPDYNLGIAQYDRGGERFFSVRYTRGREGLSLDAEDNAALKVTTEIVVKAGAKDLEVFVSKTHEKRRWARLSDQDQYIRPPTILPVITGLIKIEQDDWPAAQKLTELAADADIKKLMVLIHNPKRIRPVIVAMGRENGEQPKWDKHSVEELARQTYGFAHVVYVPFKLIDTFERNIGRKWHMNPTTVRQFNRGWTASDVLTAHPMLLELSRRPAEREAKIAEHVHAFLSPDFGRRSTENVLTFNDIYRTVVDRELARSDEPTDIAGYRERLRLVETRLGLAEQALKEAEDVAYDLLAESERRATEDKTPRDQPQAAQAGRAAARAVAPLGKRAQWKVARLEFGIPVPDRIEHVEAWAREYFPDSLVLCRPFIEDCKKINDYKRAENFYHLLTIMGIYYGAQHPQAEDLKRRKELSLGTGSLGEILTREGYTVSKPSETTLGRFRSDYQAQDPDGRRWDLDMHASDNSVGGAREILRIYYAEDPKRSRFIIGKGPGHLPHVSG